MIELCGVEKRYGSVKALRNVSLTIKKGEFFALLGPNGAGKTTLVRILLDFTRPTSGSVFIDGMPAQRAITRSRIGYLPENMRMPLYMSGRNFLKRQAMLGGDCGKKVEMMVDRAIDLTGMRDAAARPARTYSKGMLQRIGLAAALLGNPPILILDEPADGLDPVGMRDLRLILERLKAEGVTLLLNSHMLSEVERICSSAAILDRGEIVARDSLESFVRQGQSLEDVFMRCVGSGRQS